MKNLLFYIDIYGVIREREDANGNPIEFLGEELIN
jgi:hypothetical protein